MGIQYTATGLYGLRLCVYENPVVGVAGILLNEQGQILLGRRCRGKYLGYWCIPCGYVEYHEEVHEALRREFKEESNLDIEVLNPFTAQSNFHDPDKHSVGIWFGSELPVAAYQLVMIWMNWATLTWMICRI